MKRCHACGQVVENDRDRLHRNVFVWSATSVMLCATTLSVAEWTIAWWQDRAHVVATLSFVPVVALYFWIQLFRGRRPRRTER